MGEIISLKRCSLCGDRIPWCRECQKWHEGELFPLILTNGRLACLAVEFYDEDGEVVPICRDCTLGQMDECLLQEAQMS